MALPAGFPPASFRLEDGRLMCSATTANELVGTAGFSPAASRSQAGRSKDCATLRENGQRGRIRTCGPSVPDGACCCYTTRCLPRRDSEGRRGLVFVGSKSLRPWTSAPMEDWRTRRGSHPQPSRRQRGALQIELRVQMVGSGGNAPLVASGLFCDT